MKLVTKSELAEVISRSPSTVSNALKKGELHESEDGRIDVHDYRNHAWIQKRLVTPAAGDGSEDIDFDTDTGTIRSLTEQRLIADTKRIEAQRRKIELQNEKTLGNLVEAETLQAAVGMMASGFHTYLLPLGGHLAPRILAAAKTGAQVEEIRDMIETDMGDAIERTKGLIDAAIDRLFDETEEETIEPNE
jgi:phage terminase Nu1 subunit (DNA packaging protein)